MRLIRIAVARENLEAAREALEEQDVTFVTVALEGENRDSVLLELPAPSNAVDDVLDALEGAGVDTTDYTVVGSAETAMTATAERLEERYAGEYEPLTGIELRTKARDLSRDPTSYVALMVLSAFIATVGLLIDSPAIVVGSMVIAPIIGPALTASVGVVTDDRKMIVDSFSMQLYGLGVAVVAATALAALFRFGGFVPRALDLPVLDLFGVRLAPNALSLVVGLSAGVAAGIGLTTKGPTSIIGVMIAAALIPTAAATGVSLAWLEPALAIGTAALLVVTMVLINLGVFAVLLFFGYRREERSDRNRDAGRSRVVVAVLAVVVVALTLAVVVATAEQVAVDREVSSAVDDALEDPAHGDLTAVSVQTQYGDLSPFTGPRTVTVVVSEEGEADADAFAEDVADRIGDRTGESVDVRVETVDYATGSAGGGADEPL